MVVDLKAGMRVEYISPDYDDRQVTGTVKEQLNDDLDGKWAIELDEEYHRQGKCKTEYVRPRRIVRILGTAAGEA